MKAALCVLTARTLSSSFAATEATLSRASMMWMYVSQTVQQFSVVPAKAGTHYHECELLRDAGATTHSHKKTCGYGSRPSPGRQLEMPPRKLRTRCTRRRSRSNPPYDRTTPCSSAVSY